MISAIRAGDWLPMTVGGRSTHCEVITVWADGSLLIDIGDSVTMRRLLRVSPDFAAGKKPDVARRLLAAAGRRRGRP